MVYNEKSNCVFFGDNKMNKYKKLVSNTGILAIGTFASKLLVYFLMPLYTAVLTKEQYGQADLVTQIAKLLIPVVSLGISEAVFRFALDKNYKKKEVFTAGMLVLTLGFIFFAVFGPILYSIDYFSPYTLLIILYVIFANFHSLAGQYIRTRDMFRLYALQGIFNTVCVIVFNLIFLLVFDIGVTGYVLSVIIADALSFAFIFIFADLHKSFVNPRKISRDTVFSMLKYSVPLIPTTIFWWITNVSDRYIVMEFISEEATGLYSAAYKIPTLLVLICSIFIQAWNFSAVVENKSEERAVFFGNVYNAYQAMLFITSSGIIAFSKIFTRLLFADAFYESWEFIPVLAVATVFSCLVTFLGSVYVVSKKSVLTFLTSFIGALVNVVLNIVLIKNPNIGAIGAAISTFVSYFIVYVIRAVTCKKYVNFNMHSKKITLNTLIVLGQAAVIMLEIKWWIIIQAAALLIVTAINIVPLIRIVIKLFDKDTKKEEAI